jgi:hypothetical protein
MLALVIVSLDDDVAAIGIVRSVRIVQIVCHVGLLVLGAPVAAEATLGVNASDGTQRFGAGAPPSGSGPYQ